MKSLLLISLLLSAIGCVTIDKSTIDKDNIYDLKVPARYGNWKKVKNTKHIKYFNEERSIYIELVKKESKNYTEYSSTISNARIWHDSLYRIIYEGPKIISGLDAYEIQSYFAENKTIINTIVVNGVNQQMDVTMISNSDRIANDHDKMLDLLRYILSINSI